MISVIKPYKFSQNNVSFSSKIKENPNYTALYLTPVTMQTISSLNCACCDILKHTSDNLSLKSNLLQTCKNLSIIDNTLSLTDNDNNLLEFSVTNDINNKAFMITSVNNQDGSKFSLLFSNNKLIGLFDKSGNKIESNTLTAKDIENIVASISDSVDSLMLTIRQFVHNPNIIPSFSNFVFKLPSLNQEQTKVETLTINNLYRYLPNPNKAHNIELDDDMPKKRKYRSRKKKIVVTKDDFKPTVDKKAIGLLNGEYKEKLNLIKSLYKDIISLRGNLSQADILEVQKLLGETINYKGDVVVIGDKNKKRIMVQDFKFTMSPDKDFTKVCFIKSGNLFDYGVLFEDNKILKNYDFNEPYAMPFLLRYLTQKEMNDLVEDKEFKNLINTAIRKMNILKNLLLEGEYNNGSND